MKQKDLIKDMITNQTAEFSLYNLEPYSANTIAEELNLSRNTVSQYLNEFFDAGQFIKVNSRPVLYFSKKELEKRFAIKEGIADSYPNFEAFKKVVEKATMHLDAFDRLIGKNGSLASVVEKCQSSICYPYGGLPMLFLGSTGVGKSFIVDLMHQYGKEEGIFSKQSRFISINCSEYADNPELFLANVFGSKKGAYTGAVQDTEGILSLADGGLLFLDEVHCLNAKCQEKLYQFMDYGKYHMLGDNKNWYEAKVHFAFATSENPNLSLVKPFLRRIPITVNIPDLAPRPMIEKKELLYYLFTKESEKIQREVAITEQLFTILTHYEFAGNIGELANCIKVSVAAALLKDKTYETLEIDVHHLPEYILQAFLGNEVLTDIEDKRVFTLSDLRESDEEEIEIYRLNRNIIQNILLERSGQSILESLNQAVDYVNEYIDTILFDTKSLDTKKELLFSNSIRKICRKISKNYHILITNDDVLSFSKVLTDFTEHLKVCEPLFLEYKDVVEEYVKVLQAEDPDVYQMMLEFKNTLKLDTMSEMNLMYFIDRFITLDIQKETRSIIVCHGFSTASSLKNTANYVLGSNIYDSLDMPFTMSSKEIAKKLTAYLETLVSVKNVLILVDMGSLEEIHESISSDVAYNIGLLSNVNLKLVLDVGSMVLNKASVKTIVDRVEQTDYRSQCIYVVNKEKKKAIAVVSQVGDMMSNKVVNLIKMSLPRKLDISFVTWDYSDLEENGKKSKLFETYDVKHVIAMSHLKIEGYHTILLDNMIESQDMEVLESLFLDFLSKEEIQLFADQLLKVFSQENLFENLTILNPEKIVSYVEEVILELKKNLGMIFSSKVTVGLYIHISCLIERLITDKYITNYQNIETFEKKHQDFIDLTKICFERLEKDYSVDIPNSEIAYLYDYIYRLK